MLSIVPCRILTKLLNFSVPKNGNGNNLVFIPNFETRNFLSKICSQFRENRELFKVLCLFVCLSVGYFLSVCLYVGYFLSIFLSVCRLISIFHSFFLYVGYFVSFFLYCVLSFFFSSQISHIIRNFFLFLVLEIRDKFGNFI